MLTCARIYQRPLAPEPDLTSLLNGPQCQNERVGYKAIIKQSHLQFHVNGSGTAQNVSILKIVLSVGNRRVGACH